MRDLGGYITNDGYVTRWRTFIRSDFIGELTETEKNALHEIGLTTIIDLRSKAETVKYPSYLTDDDGFKLCGISLLSESAIDRSLETAPFKELYIVFAERGKRKIGSVFTAMAECSGACLFHCYAGKDRTGIIAALLLRLCGVSREDVIADYEVSGTYYRLKMINRGDGGWIHNDEMVLSRRETIEYFLDHIENKYGGAKEYLLEAGVSEIELKRLSGKFLAKL
jgi:protein-tyrosine phosphatase